MIGIRSRRASPKPGSAHKSFRPAALANLAWRSSNVQNCSASNCRAQATCKLSSVRTPRRGPWRRAKSAERSKTLSGSSTSSHTSAARSFSRWRYACSACAAGRFCERLVAPRHACTPRNKETGPEARAGLESESRHSSAFPRDKAKRQSWSPRKPSIASTLLDEKVGSRQNAVTKNLLAASREVWILDC